MQPHLCVHWVQCKQQRCKQCLHLRTAATRGCPEQQRLAAHQPGLRCCGHTILLLLMFFLFHLLLVLLVLLLLLLLLWATNTLQHCKHV